MKQIPEILLFYDIERETFVFLYSQFSISYLMFRESKLHHNIDPVQHILLQELSKMVYVQENNPKFDNKSIPKSKRNKRQSEMAQYMKAENISLHTCCFEF